MAQTLSFGKSVKSKDQRYLGRGWDREEKIQMPDSDNKVISVQVQLDLDLPTGTELGNNRISTK